MHSETTHLHKDVPTSILAYLYPNNNMQSHDNCLQYSRIASK